MKYENLIIELDGNCLTVTIHKPQKLNCLSISVFDDLKHLLGEIKNGKYPEARGVMLTGSGSKAFIAGADISEMNAMSVKEGEAYGRYGQQITCLLEELPLPVIGCINGYALGGGCEIAMACDILIATENARFGQPEVKLGLIPGFGGCVRLFQYVGPSLAKELIYTGQMITADQAKECKLVSDVFKTKEEMLSHGKKLIDTIALNSPQAVTICKKVLTEINAAYKNTALEIEALGFKEAFESSDKKVGVKAFLDKLPPKFSKPS